jgi:hypothetical protein
MNIVVLSNPYGGHRSGALIAKELKTLDKNIKKQRIMLFRK